MQLDTLRDKAKSFFEWPSEDKMFVTTTSALLFAEHCVEEVEAKYRDKVAALEAAITKTLNENGHLADGDVCTLIDLKRVMPNWELEYTGGILDLLINQPIKTEICEPAPNQYSAGDYVTRDGTDIHFVERKDDDFGLVDVVCIVAPSMDWTKPGETESNWDMRYCRINKHFLPFARSEHEKLKQQYPDGWLQG